MLTTDGKVLAYKGIPFAAPPVGNLRWREPQPAKPWKGTFAASAFGPHCIQSGSFADMVFHDPGPSEDCLTLNVWTPANAKPVRPNHPGGLPVMVWIFGGGAVTGGTSERRQDGQFLAERNVVVVSMNYRLGVFGFLALPGLTAESPHHASGNYALMDQAAAIAWVRRNIAAFGGDPANITLFGESAGSFSVSAQMASPLARNLLARAIGESGGAFPASGGYPSLAEAEQADADWAKRNFGSADPAVVRAVPAEDVLRAALAKADPTTRTPAAPRFNFIIDGYALPEPVSAIYAAGQQAQIPLLAGWNANESRSRTPATTASWADEAKALFGTRSTQFLDLYPGSTDAEAAASANDFASDMFIAYSTWAWIEADMATTHDPIYRYHFDLGSPGDRNHPASLGAFHSDDIEYVFGTLDSRPGIHVRPEDRQLSDLIQQYWTNFARTGDPNGPGLPHWPRYNDKAARYPVMHLDPNPEARPDSQRDRYLFLQSDPAALAAAAKQAR